MEEIDKKLNEIAMDNVIEVFNKQPIEEKISQGKENNKRNEIDKIITELPIEDKKPKKETGKKPNLSKVFKNKIILYGSIGIGLVLLSLFLFTSSSCNCPIIENTTEVSCPDGSISFDLIREQIINKGYAEITDGSSTIKLSPYIE